MHSSITITDGIYGGLSTMDVKKQIDEICKRKDEQLNSKDIIDLLNQILEMLEK